MTLSVQYCSLIWSKLRIPLIIYSKFWEGITFKGYLPHTEGKTAK
jgi:hypothetical protein